MKKAEFPISPIIIIILALLFMVIGYILVTNYMGIGLEGVLDIFTLI